MYSTENRRHAPQSGKMDLEGEIERRLKLCEPMRRTSASGSDATYLLGIELVIGHRWELRDVDRLASNMLDVHLSPQG